MEDPTAVVVGKRRLLIAGHVLRAEASRYEYVVVDLGTGDGRWIYRIARRRPLWFCLGVDANAKQMHQTSSRARRKLNRGGTRNLWYIQATVQALPRALDGLADEIHVHFPWGSLLATLVNPDPVRLASIARVGKPGARFWVQINESAMYRTTLLARLGGPEVLKELAPAYATAGIHLGAVRMEMDEPSTSWGRRVHGRDTGRVIIMEGAIATSE